MKLELNSRTRFFIVAIICLVAALFAAFGMDWVGYVQSWIGAVFRAISGGAIGWAISRFVLRLDLSEIPPEERVVAAISQALLIGFFALAVAVGT